MWIPGVKGTKLNPTDSFKYAKIYFFLAGRPLKLLLVNKNISGLVMNMDLIILTRLKMGDPEVLIMDSF